MIVRYQTPDKIITAPQCAGFFIAHPTYISAVTISNSFRISKLTICRDKH